MNVNVRVVGDCPVGLSGWPSFCGLGCDEGEKDRLRVPENRTTDTARATGRPAVKGLG